MKVIQPAAAEALFDPELRARCAELIEGRFGLRLSAAQAAKLELQVMKAAQDMSCESPWALYQALAAGRYPDVLEVLATQLTVGETHFFRIGPQIEALRNTLLADIIGRRSTERRLRIWVAGCSTGEEPYTLAILLREQLPALKDWDIRLLATDISRPALEAAERAEYGGWSFRDTPEEMRERYFRRNGSRWHLVDTVRRLVEFAQVNLADEPLEALGLSPGDLDLILCRNVTIYFSADAAQRLYRRFATALAPQGWLILGPSDPAPERGNSLQARYMAGAVLWQRSAPGAGEQPRRRETDQASRRTPVPAAKRPQQWTKTPTNGRRNRAREIPAAGPRRRQVDGLRALARQDRGMARDEAAALTRKGTLEADVYVLLGMLYLDEHAYEPAIEALRRATFLQADNPLAHFGLATAYRQIGQMERARAALLHARRLLTALPAECVLEDADGMTVDDLRHAVETRLTEVGASRER